MPADSTFPRRPLCFERQVPLPRIACPTRETFLSEYVRPGRPVIVTGALREGWSLERLRERFGNEQLEFVAGFLDPRGTPRRQPSAPSPMRLSEFIDGIQSHDERRYTQLASDPGTLAAKVRDALEGESFFPENEQCSYLWVGNESGGIGLHQDPGYDNLLFEMVGRKHVVLIDASELASVHPYSYYDPDNHGDARQYDVFRSRATENRLIDDIDLAQFPNLARAEAFVGWVEPNEALYIPNSWFHCLTNLGPNVALTRRWESPSYFPQKRQFVALLDLLLRYLASLPEARRGEFASRALLELTQGKYADHPLFPGPLKPPGFGTWQGTRDGMLTLVEKSLEAAAAREEVEVNVNPLIQELDELGAGDLAEKYRRLHKEYLGLIRFY